MSSSEYLEVPFDQKEFKSANDMIEYLKKALGHPFEVSEAKDKYTDLHMDQFDTFQAFKTEFTLTANLAHISKNDWFHDLKRKITPKLRLRVSALGSLKSMTFDDFCDICQETDYELRYFEAKNPKKSTTTSGKSAVKSDSKDTRNKDVEPTTTTYKVKTEERGRTKIPARTTPASDLNKDFNCFNCGEAGHLAKDCPNPRMTGVFKEIDKEASGSDSDPASDEEQNKRRSLGRDSALGRCIDFRYLDLTKLLGGSSFTTTTSAVKNGIQIDLHTLVDTGAHCYVILNSRHAKDVAHALQSPIEDLNRPLWVKGFDSVSRKQSTQVIWSHFKIDRRVCWNVPFLLIDIGTHDAIIGLSFMEEMKWLLDCVGKQILWPKSIPPTFSVMRYKQLSLANAHKNRIEDAYRNNVSQRRQKGQPIPLTAHQQDADRRDALLDDTDNIEPNVELKLVQRGNNVNPVRGVLPIDFTTTQKGPRQYEPIVDDSTDPIVEDDYIVVNKEEYSTRLATTYGRSYEEDRRDSLGKMDSALSVDNKPGLPVERQRPKTRRASEPEFIGPLYRDGICQIALINSSTMERNMKVASNEVFIATLQDIDNIIYDKEQEAVLAKEDTDTADLIRKKLPKKHAHQSDVFSKVDSNKLPPHRKYDHKIELTEPLPDRSCPLYRQSLAELQETKKWVTDNLDKGFIEATSAPFASPILFVKKADGTLRLCVDYRQLNKVTKKNQYPLPLVDEILAKLSKAKIYTKLDIRAAFNRIRMDPESEDLTALRTSIGSYKCKVLPFGLTNGPATYQRYMNEVLMDYPDIFCTAYLDDILIYSEDEASHEIHVNAVLDRLRQAGLNADIKKSEFGVTRTKYLGFIVTTEGLEIDPDKTEPLRNWQFPTTVREVRGFLGFTGFYRRFVKDYGRIAKPLHRLTKDNIPFQFDLECQRAFNALRDTILGPSILKHFHYGYPTMVESDSSDGTVGAVLSQQHPDGEWYPVAVYSHTMLPAECNYEIHDKELLAIVRAFEVWEPELSSAGPDPILVYSDHQALQYFMTKRALTSRQGRWNEILSRFHWVLQYRQGRANGKADALTRRTQERTLQEEAMRAHRARVMLRTDNLDSTLQQQQSDLPETDPNDTLQEKALNTIEQVVLLPIESTDNTPLPLVQELLEENKSSFADIKEDMQEGYSMNQGLLLHNSRLVVKKERAASLLDLIHSQLSTAHPGINKTYSLTKAKYFWPGMKQDVEQYVRNCSCLRDKARRDKQPGILKPLPIPSKPWEHITMDFLSLPKSKSGYNSAWVVMDRLSKQSITIACHKTIDAKGLARLYYENVYRFGHTPTTIISDRGPQFISTFWQDFCALIGSKVKLSTAFHKETDGQTEIMNQYLLQRLRSFVNHNQDNWDELLPSMDRVQATLPQDSIGMSPYELLHGTHPRFDFDWDKSCNPGRQAEPTDRQAAEYVQRLQEGHESAKKATDAAQDKKRRDVDPYRRQEDFEVDNIVWLSSKNLRNDRPSRKLSHKWYGPFKVLEKVGSSYQLDIPQTWKTNKVHDVFAPELLRKAADNPLPGQELEEPAPEIVDEDYEWEVQDILDVKKVRSKLWYKASWVGFDEDLDWHPASDFQHSPQKLRDFHNQYPDKTGPPKELDKWIQEWEDYSSD